MVKNSLSLSHTGHVSWGLPEAVSMSNPLILYSCIPHHRSQQNPLDSQEKIAYVGDVIMFPFGGNVWNLYHHLWCKVSCSPHPQVWEVLLMHGFVKREIMSDFHLSILPSPILASFFSPLFSFFTIYIISPPSFLFIMRMSCISSLWMCSCLTVINHSSVYTISFGERWKSDNICKEKTFSPSHLHTSVHTIYQFWEEANYK